MLDVRVGRTYLTMFDSILTRHTLGMETYATKNARCGLTARVSLVSPGGRNSGVWWRAVVGALVFWGVVVLLHSQCGLAAAQVSRASRTAGEVASAGIHWQDLPLSDAINRLEPLFGTTIFVDRRIDRSQRLNVDVSTTSAQEVLQAAGSEHGWGATRVGEVVYLGPELAARNLSGLLSLQKAKIELLPKAARATFERKRGLEWVRLTEPRELVKALLQRNGYKVEEAERIPHDLWAAGKLKGFSLADQLTLVLYGFDLTFEVDPSKRAIEIVPIDMAAVAAARVDERAVVAEPKSKGSERKPAVGTKQVYTLRVSEQPVGVVVDALAQRFNMPVEFDEAAIRAAGLSVNRRVSFAVENADQDELFHAVLQPAGLTFERDGERLRIVPIRGVK